MTSQTPDNIYASSDEHAELVFGLSAAVGSPIDFVVNALEKGLRDRGYEVETVRISSFTDAIKLSAAAPKAGAREYDRVRILMDRGNELRKSAGRGDVLALFVAAHINSQRQNDPPQALSRKAFILRQIKHPEEVYALRGIYGDGFHQIGIYCPKSARQQYLMQHSAASPQTERSR